MATRRHFTQEYKDQAVSLVLDSGRSIAEVAKSIGVHEMTLGKWVKKAKDSGQAPTGICPRASGLSWNGSARRTPPCGWSVISRKK